MSTPPEPAVFKFILILIAKTMRENFNFYEISTLLMHPFLEELKSHESEELGENAKTKKNIELT